MVTITDGQLPWVIGLSAAILIAGAWFVVLAYEDIRRRRDRKRKGRAIVDKARQPLVVDLHSEAFVDQVGLALGPTPDERADERIRAEARREAEAAAFVTPGMPVADEFLRRMFPRTKDAPKERP
jgi:hypothetical protein